MPLVAAVPTRVSDKFNVFEIFGAIAVSGSYVNNGVTLDLTPLIALAPSSAVLPDWVEITEMPASGAIASGYTFRYAFGTGITNGKVQAMNGAGTQAAASTFASLGIVSIYYRVQFTKF